MLKKFLASAFILISTAILIIAIYIFYPRNIPTNYLLEVPQGTSLSGFAKKLHSINVISDINLFIKFMVYLDLESSLKAGNYRLKSNTSLYSIIHKVITGKSESLSVTLIEGETTDELFERLKSKKLKDIDNIPNYKKFNDVDIKSQEGIFFPDTYFYDHTSTLADILALSHQKMSAVLQDIWDKRKANLPYKNSYEALIMASIIEKETHILKEKPIVSAVFVNRIKKGMPLQADPTVVYGLGKKYTGKLRKSDLRRNTPFNTYINKGLPPTPICNPSRSSIYAALNPESSTYLYFVLNKNGQHIFTKTLQDHKIAVTDFRQIQKIQKQLLRLLNKIAEIK